MKTFKFTDQTNTIVHVIDEDGISRESRLASTLTPEELAQALPTDHPTPEELAAEKAAVLDEFRKLRDTALARLNGIQMDSTVQSDIDAIKAAKQGLKDMPQHASVVAAVGGDATEDALQAVYAAISVQLYQSAPSAYTAFRGLDL